ncbi:MAG: DUF1016 family protein [Bacteroidales bacterium]|nr:DUF1016 family protein [Bacteroidales bacterium]
MNNEKDKPTFIYRDGMTADKEYVAWLHELKERYLRGQIRASIKVNSEMLAYYWSLGRDIVMKQAESKWGSGFFNQLSLDMRKMFPNENGFSVTNLKYMKRWYVFYTEGVGIRQQVADEFRHQACDDLEISDTQRVMDKTVMPEFFSKIPWFHHVQIFTKSKSANEAFFYINKVVAEGWSRNMLENKMANNLFYAQGAAITNFDSALPAPQSQLAKELLKNEYNLSFISAKDIEHEKDLEDALAKNVTQFLLELGKGFAYLGKQQELRIDEDTAFFPDLLFYHIPQRRYVIVELKAVKFMPEFAGKLNFYVTAADKLLRGPGDNPSVGLLICKTAKKTIVEWSLQDIQKPLGVATYQLQEVVARTIEEIEQTRRKEK